MYKRSIIFAITTVAVACQQEPAVDFASTTGSSSPLTILVSEPSTRGSLATSEALMSSMGIYCAYTEDEPWSTKTKFEKMDNLKYYYCDDGCSWLCVEGAQEWECQSPDDLYTFYAYSPYADDDSHKGDKENDNGITPYIEDGELKIKYCVPEDCASQPDLLYATPIKDTEAYLNGCVPLTFHHTLSTICFSVTGTGTTKITAISITGVENEGILTWTNNTPEWDYSSSRECDTSFSIIVDSDYTPPLDQNTTTQVSDSTGYLMMIPQSLDSGAEVTIEFDDETSAELSITKGTRWEAGRLYNYVITIDEPEEEEERDYIFDRTEISNCYIINADPNDSTTVQIPIEDRIIDFWTNYAGADEAPIDSSTNTWELTAEMLWEDFDSTLDYGCQVLRDDDGYLAVRIILPNNAQDGNTVFVVKDSRSGTVLWSWHLWVTPYDPDTIAKNSRADITPNKDKAYTIDGYEGAVHRYVDADGTSIWDDIYADKFIMDRNLGARDAEYQEDFGAGILYYQFGRKDPFPAKAIRYRSGIEGQDEVETLLVSGTTFSYAVENPGLFLYNPSSTNGYYWCIEDDSKNSDYLWNDRRSIASDKYNIKSIFDPSPLGWRLPINGTWSGIVSTEESIDCDGEAVNVAYYPIHGYRLYYNGKVYENSSMAFVWSATRHTYSNGYSYFVSSSRASSASSIGSIGMNVRCVEE